MSMNQPTGGHGRTAGQADVAKLRERYDWLESFSNDELGMLVFLREGEAMRPGEEYFDVSNPEIGIFRGRDGQTAEESSRYVPKSGVPHDVWDKLTGPFA